MIILGLTGSIGMGKTTIATALRDMGYPVHDADQVVHELLEKDRPLIDAVAEEFGDDIIKDGGVDRARLGACVFADEARLGRLEKNIHPRVRASVQAFLEGAANKRAKLAVLDIPLLFETGAEKRCDYTLLVSAPGFIQKRRVRQRPGMTREKFAAIRARQMSEAEKKKRADVIIQTGLSLSYSLRQLRQALKMILEKGKRESWKNA